MWLQSTTSCWICNVLRIAFHNPSLHADPVPIPSPPCPGLRLGGATTLLCFIDLGWVTRLYIASRALRCQPPSRRRLSFASNRWLFYIREARIRDVLVRRLDPRISDASCLRQQTGFLPGSSQGPGVDGVRPLGRTARPGSDKLA